MGSGEWGVESGEWRVGKVACTRQERDAAAGFHASGDTQDARDRAESAADRSMSGKDRDAAASDRAYFIDLVHGADVDGAEVDGAERDREPAVKNGSAPEDGGQEN